MALTAFSFHPIKERFDKLVELAAAVDKIATESDGEQVGSPWAILGLPKCLIMDIFNVARYCRWDLLTWREGWTHLEPLCQKYMAEKDEMTSVTEELNFVKVDYSRFKNMPRPEGEEKTMRVAAKKTASFVTPTKPQIFSKKRRVESQPEGVKRSSDRIQRQKVCFSLFLFPRRISLIYFFFS